MQLHRFTDQESIWYLPFSTFKSCLKEKVFCKGGKWHRPKKDNSLMRLRSHYRFYQIKIMILYQSKNLTQTALSLPLQSSPKSLHTSARTHNQDMFKRNRTLSHQEIKLALTLLAEDKKETKTREINHHLDIK